MYVRTGRRIAQPSTARGTAQPKPFPAPVRGLVTAENLASSRGASAIVLENFFPTQTGIVPRGGAPRFATIDEGLTEPVRSMMAYKGGSSEKLFAADETQIFDITTPADTDTAPTPDVTGQTAGYYSSLNFATTGGNYLVAVNGADLLQLYDGTNWYPVTSTNLYALDYDAETGTFTEGLTVTGGTSGATGTLFRLIDDGTTGTLWLTNVSGTFQNDETITDSSTGSATADGTATLLTAAITGADTDTFSHVNAYRSRLYFVGGDMNVYYLPVDSIGGAVGTLTLNGTFKNGGAVLFTATWSLDSGAGLDDKLVVVSTEGEVAVFEGSDPSNFSTWSLIGVYDMPPPLGMNAIMRAGGDLIIATEGGMIPISQAVQKDPAALSIAAISRAIEPDWAREARARSALPWEIVKWPEQNRAFVSLPVTSTSDEPLCFVVNLETGAWTVYRGWETRCFELHAGEVYYGDNAGRIYKAEVGGYDDVDTAYTAICVCSWDHLSGVGSYKTVEQMRAVFRTQNAFLAQLSGSVDYAVNLPNAPNTVAAEAANSVWDTGLWDEAVWDVGSEFYTVTTRWVSIGVSGIVFAPQLQMTIGGVNKPTAELAIFDVMLGGGGMVV